MLRSFASISITVLAMIAGCGGGTTLETEDAGERMDAARSDGSRPGSDGARNDADMPPGEDGSVDDDASAADASAPDGAIDDRDSAISGSDSGVDLCATVRCADGFTCCRLDGTCQPSGCLACCMFPRGDAGPRPRTDGGISRCAAILCRPDYECCEDSGSCEPLGSCADPGGGDGGRFDCRLSGCPGRLACCEASGTCHDPSCLGCCRVMP